MVPDCHLSIGFANVLICLAIADATAWGCGFSGAQFETFTRYSRRDGPDMEGGS
jgi:hypothetical protein